MADPRQELSRAEDAASNALLDWYEGYRQPNGNPPKAFVINAGLIAIERLQDDFGAVTQATFTTPSHRFKGTAHQVQAILARHGETRRLKSEGGRTTGSTIPAATALADKLQSLDSLRSLPEADRKTVLAKLQKWLTHQATAYLEQEGIEIDFDIQRPLAMTMRAILDEARRRNVAGAVAQHLVGAKLALRHRDDPRITVPNFNATTKDDSLGRAGDFVINTTVFHVTMNPTDQLAEKCGRNVRANLDVEVLVPEEAVQYARRLLTDRRLEHRVGVSAIEAFVGQNIGEIGRHDRQQKAEALQALFEEYNRRIAEVETDRGLRLIYPASIV